MSSAGKHVQNGTNEINDYMRAPDTRTRWQVIKDGFYNPTKSTYLGRTKKQWGITGLFYLVFYAVLAVFIAICMGGLLLSIDSKKPRWTMDEGLIGINPGMGFRPAPVVDASSDERSLIGYNAQNSTQVQKWISRLDDFLEKYTNTSALDNAGRNQQICDYKQQTVKDGYTCAMDVTKWETCTHDNGYGFNNSSPCIFIKLNRIIGWVPEFYNNSAELPDDMPKSLVQVVKTVDPSELNTVWVSCDGEAPGDRENIGPLEYFPKTQGFPGFYYPYLFTPGYLSPLVAVHFKRPQPNRIIAVVCRAWAKNIKYDSKFKLGMVHFELLID